MQDPRPHQALGLEAGEMVGTWWLPTPDMTYMTEAELRLLQSRLGLCHGLALTQPVQAPRAGKPGMVQVSGWVFCTSMESRVTGAGASWTKAGMAVACVSRHACRCHAHASAIALCFRSLPRATGLLPCVTDPASLAGSFSISSLKHLCNVSCSCPDSPGGPRISC